VLDLDLVVVARCTIPSARRAGIWSPCYLIARVGDQMETATASAQPRRVVGRPFKKSSPSADAEASDHHRQDCAGGDTMTPVRITRGNRKAAARLLAAALRPTVKRGEPQPRQSSHSSPSLSLCCSGSPMTMRSVAMAWQFAESGRPSFETLAQLEALGLRRVPLHEPRPKAAQPKPKRHRRGRPRLRFGPGLGPSISLARRSGEAAG
jgi:hypothetical protein